MMEEALRGPLEELQHLKALQQREAGALRAQLKAGEEESKRLIAEQGRMIDGLSRRALALEVKLQVLQMQQQGGDRAETEAATDVEGLTVQQGAADVATPNRRPMAVACCGCPGCPAGVASCGHGIT